MFVVVLNDGETYTDLDGCEVLFLDVDEYSDDVDELVKEYYGHGIPVGELLEAYEWLQDRDREMGNGDS